MDSRQKKQLKRQLEGQASLLVSENSDVALVAGLLTTCSALLRTAEQNMPAAFTNQEFDQIYAGYLGLAGGVNRFSQFGQGYLSQNYKTLLQEQMDKATQLQQERKTLEDQLTQTQHSGTVSSARRSSLNRIWMRCFRRWQPQRRAIRRW